MAAEKKTGTDILFKSGNQVVAGQTDVSFSVSAQEIEISSKDTDYWAEYLPGRADATVSGSGIIMFDEETDTFETTQKAIFTAITTRQVLDVEIAFTDDLVFSGRGFFTSYGGSAPDNAPTSFEWTVRITEGLTLEEGA